MTGQGLLQVGRRQAGRRRIRAGQQFIGRRVRAAGLDLGGPARGRAAHQQLLPGQPGRQCVQAGQVDWPASAGADWPASARTDRRASRKYVTPPKNSPMSTLKSEPSTWLDSGDTYGE